jgi:hypothetical protein
MRSVRLFVAATLLLSPWIFAQETQQKNPTSEGASLTSDSQLAINGPLRFDRSATAEDPLLSLQAARTPVFKFDPAAKTNRFLTPDKGGFVISPDLLPADTVCLKIRSYLMARDSKGSDSTHPVGYSTCQPASRYRLRTAVGSTETERSR